MKSNPVVTLSALALERYGRGPVFGGMEGQVARRLGLGKLGATYVEVEPGKSLCPFHVHHVVDEMFVLLEGEGEYRFGDETHRVSAGDVLGAPCGGPELAHRLTNVGSGTLKYLAISSMAEADVCEYPDSGKFAVGSGLPDGRFHFVGRPEDKRDYWEGEEALSRGAGGACPSHGGALSRGARGACSSHETD